MCPCQGDGGGIGEKWLAEEACVPASSLRVEDPELRPPPRRAEAVPGDDHLRSLADDVPTEPDPRPSGELEPEPGRLGDGDRDRHREARWLKDDEENARPPGERGEPPEPVRDRRRPTAVSSGPSIRPGHPVGSRWALRLRLGSRARWGRRVGGARDWSRRVHPLGRKIHEQEVHGPSHDERAGHRQGLVQRGRLEDHEPLKADPAGDCLHRVQAPTEIDVRDDRAGRLGFRRQPERERRLPAGGVPPEGERRRARNAARPEDRIKLGESRPDHPIIVERVVADYGPDAREPLEPRLAGKRNRCERPDDLTHDAPGTPDRLPETARRGRSPARPQGRQGRRNVRGEVRHRMAHDRTPVLSVKGWWRDRSQLSGWSWDLAPRCSSCNNGRVPRLVRVATGSSLQFPQRKGRTPPHKDRI